MPFRRPGGISEARPQLSPGGPGNFRSEEFPTATQRCCGFAVWWKHLNQYLVCFPMDVGGAPDREPPELGHAGSVAPRVVKKKRYEKEWTGV